MAARGIRELPDSDCSKLRMPTGFVLTPVSGRVARAPFLPPAEGEECCDDGDQPDEAEDRFAHPCRRRSDCHNPAAEGAELPTGDLDRLVEDEIVRGHRAAAVGCRAGSCGGRCDEGDRSGAIGELELA
jgi:hypothetical protein